MVEALFSRLSPSGQDVGDAGHLPSRSVAAPIAEKRLSFREAHRGRTLATVIVRLRVARRRKKNEVSRDKYYLKNAIKTGRYVLLRLRSDGKLRAKFERSTTDAVRKDVSRARPEKRTPSDNDNDAARFTTSKFIDNKGCLIVMYTNS